MTAALEQLGRHWQTALLVLIPVIAALLRTAIEAQSAFYRRRLRDLGSRLSKGEVQAPFDPARSRQRRVALLANGWHELTPGIFVQSATPSAKRDVPAPSSPTPLP